MSATKQSTALSSKIQTETISWTTVYAILVAIFIGVLIITTVGFAGPELLHNAAHDIRHGLAFPCH